MCQNRETDAEIKAAGLQLVHLESALSRRRTMFEGLDQIDWEGAGHHVYGRHNEIPAAIRGLLSSDPGEREEWREFLLGGGQDFGDIYDTTPYILPFIFEILRDPDSPGKEELLDHLASVARHVWDADYLSVPEMRLHLSVRKMRLHLKTYDTLKAGLPTLLVLLADNSKAVRLTAIDLLQDLTGELETLLPEFMRRFHHEKEEEVQVALLRGLKSLLSAADWTQLELKAQCKLFLNEIVENHPSPRIQIAGAQAAVEAFERHITRDLSPKVANILAHYFWQTSKAIDAIGWSEEFDTALIIIRDLARLNASNHLLDMLHNPEITPVQAHLIARGLLAVFMLYPDDLYWNCRRDHDVKGRELDYVHSQPSVRSIEIYVRNRDTFDERFLRLLEAIVESQKFWEIPTNMFSFFAGLPDSREELRVLLSPGPGQ